MYMNDTDSSFGQKELDQLLNEFTIENNGVTINVEEYEVDHLTEQRYIVEFEYRDVQYQLKGVMAKNELEKIIEQIK